MAEVNPRAREVLDFWFGPEPGATLPQWFRKDPAFDRTVAQRFGALIDDALAGRLTGWADEPDSALAQVIVLDQFTRNAGRDTARAFAGDGRALAAAQAIVARGWDRAMTGVQRLFVYLPFEHSEVLAVQDVSLRLFEALAHDAPDQAGLLEWARRHRDVVARFGRFPHRNAMLGRVNTPDESTFLAQPGSGF